ncbi:YolD-like family protein [Amedibacterium intestinale]|uniref:YolD-like family protein n=1 Tax=Amedibacterium intestinale TaxID=2583452 RepID=UPI000E2017E1
MQNRKKADRAKIFIPFESLKGFKDYLKEKERVVVERKLLLEDVCEELDRKLHSLKKGDMIRIVYYDKDAYVKIEGMLADIDLEYKKRIRVVNTWIDLEDIVVIER